VAGGPEGSVGAVLAYHESTKHSPVSIRSRAHFLDWGKAASVRGAYDPSSGCRRVGWPSLHDDVGEVPLEASDAFEPGLLAITNSSQS
jgi:hypothetical protein